jgi:hypothetical protein
MRVLYGESGRGRLHAELMHAVAAGQTEQAQDRAVVLMRSPWPWKAAQAKAFLRDLTGMAMVQGDFALAERPWLRLDPLRSPLARNFLVRFWRRYSCYDPDRLRRIAEYLRLGVDANSAALAFPLLAMNGHMDTSSRALLAAYVRRHGNIRRVACRRLALAAAEIELALAADDRRLRALLSQPAFQPDIAKALDLSRHAVEAHLPTTEAMRRTAAMAVRMDQDSAQIWRDLTDPAKSVAVVGNSPCEVGGGKGPQIDSHDIVLRFNTGTVDRTFRPDYGTRTDYVVCNLGRISGLDPHIPTLRGAIVANLTSEQNRDLFELIQAVSANGLAIGTIPAPDVAQLRRALGADPSSGIGLCYSLAKARGSGDGLSFYGFGFVDQIGPEARSASYVVAKTPSYQHNWTGEAQVFARIAGARPADLRLDSPEILKGRYPRLDFRPVRIRIRNADGTDPRQAEAALGVVAGEARKHGIVVADDAYDLLVVNGDDALHDDSRSVRRTLDAIARDLDRGRKCTLVNTVWQNNGKDHAAVLRRLDGLTVKDRFSQSALADACGLVASIAPDLRLRVRLPEPRLRLSRRRTVLMAGVPTAEVDRLSQAARAWHLRPRRLDCDGARFETLAAAARRASLVVSADAALIYAAIRTHTPFVAMPGRTRQIEALLMAAESAIPVRATHGDWAGALDFAMTRTDAYADLRDWIGRQKPWHLTIGPWSGAASAKR